jgi:hypothetical protein
VETVSNSRIIHRQTHSSWITGLLLRPESLLGAFNMFRNLSQEFLLSFAYENALVSTREGEPDDLRRDMQEVFALERLPPI